VKKRKEQGYRPWEIYENDPRLRACIDALKSGMFSRGDKELWKPLLDHLLHHDTYMLFADFASYISMQDQVDKVYKDTKRWTKMSILNVARSGKFSSDRAIAEYARDIWNVTPVPVTT
jgi:glycogen phosphorylase